MNPLLKDHILARLDKVYDGTIHIFSDSFFSSLDVVANALDNVQARRYVIIYLKRKYSFLIFNYFKFLDGYKVRFK